jgi:hypothetical protein
MSVKESPSAVIGGKESLDRMADLTRKIIAVKKAAIPKVKAKKRKKR